MKPSKQAIGLYNYEHEPLFEKISLLLPPAQIADPLWADVSNARAKFALESAISRSE